MSKFIPFIFGLIIYLSGNNLSASNPVIFSNDDRATNIGSFMSIYEDTSSIMKWNDVLKKNNFISSNSEVLNLGVSKSSFWIKFKVKNNTELNNLLLHISNPLIDEITLFMINGEKKKENEIKISRDFSTKKRRYNHQDFVFNLNIDPNKTDEFLIKVRSTKMMVLPFTIETPKYTENAIRTKDLIFGIFTGIMIVMLLYNLFIYFTVRDISYLYYVAYILIVALTQLAFQGYTYKYIWPGFSWMIDESFFILSSLVGITAAEFLKNFLQTKKFTPTLHKGFTFFYISYFISLTLILFKLHTISHQLIDLTAMTISFYMLFIAIKIARKGYRPAIFFLVSWSIFLAGVTVFAMKNFGVLPSNNFTSYTMPIGAAIETILLSFALADKINIFRKEKEAAQKESVLALKKNEVLIREQNKVLEEKVTERTAELNSSNEELNSTLNNLKETQSQLVDAEKMASLGQLTAGIAHEINNPINFVSSNIIPLRQDINDFTSILNKYEEIKETTDLKEKLQEVEELKNELDFDYLKEELSTIINGIEDGAKRTTEIVRGLKNFSRLDESDLKIVNINEGVESTLKLITSRLKDNNIKLEKVLGDIPKIECFPGKLNQLFMNVISNSIQAIELKSKSGDNNEQGLISIKTTHNDDFVTVSIKDNGVGMSEKTKTRMFEPFFTTKDVGEGTGLGMSIVYSIIEAHKGNIKVDTEVGKGTEMIINIPIKQVAI